MISSSLTLPFIFFSILSFQFFMPSTHARIGETRSTLEKRLVNSGGVQYRETSILENRMKGMPYNKYKEYYPKSTDLRIYYKTSDGRQPKASEMQVRGMLEGWDLHVIYLDGVSVMEIYRRSKTITEFEFIYLLNFQAGGSYWKKAADMEPLEDDEESAFGFEFIRDDKKVRAKKLGGNGFMVFTSELDRGFAEALKADLKSMAPKSVNGF